MRGLPDSSWMFHLKDPLWGYPTAKSDVLKRVCVKDRMPTGVPNFTTGMTRWIGKDFFWTRIIDEVFTAANPKSAASGNASGDFHGRSVLVEQSI